VTARPLAVGALLLAVYLATLGITASGEERYAGDELHHLLAAKSWSEDGDMDLTDQYAQRDWAEFGDTRVEPSAEPTAGRLHEPQGMGLPMLVSPAYALGGARGVEALIAVFTAIGFALAAALALRLVPEPWASGGVLVVGLSPPALAAATTVAPEPVAGALLAGAALCALRVRERARLRYAYGGGLLLALLPWLDLAVALGGVPVGIALVRWTLAERRRLVALLAAELMLGSLVFFARLSETFYGGPAPAFARIGGPDPDEPAEWLERLANLATLWLDPRAGLLRWAPVLALAFVACWLLWRSRHTRVAAAIPERREAERAAELLLATAGATWLGVALGIDGPDGPWFPGLPMAAALPVLAPLVAWGLRHARAAGVVLAVVTLALSAWALADARLGESHGWLTAAGL
jgi:hypothetical protein